MKKKTINAKIKTKIEDWVDSIEDKDLQKLVERDTIVTGGCIASMFLNEDVNDYDVYFRTLETTYKVCEYYANKMNQRISKEVVPQIVIRNSEINHISYSAKETVELGSVIDYIPTLTEDLKYRVRAFISSDGIVKDESYNADDEFEGVPSIEDKDREKYYPVYISSNAITLSNKIQIVIRFYGEPEIIHDNYDFIHCTNYWTFETGLVSNIQALECLLSKELRYFGSRYPLSSVLRTKKFINRGWQVNAGQYIKMVFQLNEMDLSNIEVLEEQLTGVDIAYMHGLIEAIKKKVEEDENFSINSYLLKVVEQIFD